MFIPVRDLWWLAAGGAGYGARYMKMRIDAVVSARRRSRLPDPTGELLHLMEQLEGTAHPAARDGVWFSKDGKRALLVSGETGEGLATLRDAADYIQKLSKAEQQLPHWQTAVDMLMKVAEQGFPLMFADIAMKTALLHGKPEPPKERKEVKLEQPDQRQPPAPESFSQRLSLPLPCFLSLPRQERHL